MVGLKRVAILSVSAGTGHHRAAAALQAAIKEKYPECNVNILDTFRYTSPFLEKVVLGTYMEMLRFTPVIYGYLYRKAERGQPLAGAAKQEFQRLLNLVTAPRLTDYLSRFQPQVIICTHPFPLGVLAELKRRGQLKVPLVGVITDYTVHSFWVFSEVDCYLVGHETLVGELVSFGIDKVKVIPLGIPIDPIFSLNGDKRQRRLELGLPEDRLTVMVSGGGLGLGPLVEVVKVLGQLPFAITVLVATGRNNELRRRIERLAEKMPNLIRVYGYVLNIHHLMQAADLLVSKAGGLTCAEAMAVGLPMIIVAPLPGQEERNTEFITAAGAALRLREPSELTAVIQRCSQDPDFLSNMRSAALALGRPAAARQVVELLISLVATPGDVGREGRPAP